MLLKTSLILVLCFLRNHFCAIHEWKQLDFLFPNPAEREQAIREKRFNGTNCFPIDTDVHHQGMELKKKLSTKENLLTFNWIGIKC